MQTCKISREVRVRMSARPPSPEPEVQCNKLQQVCVPPSLSTPPEGEAEEAAERDSGGGGGGGGAAVAGGGGEDAAAGDEEFAHRCPICWDNEDNAYVDGQVFAQCFACGQMYCGGCNTTDGIGRVRNCPYCRAPFDVSGEDQFKRLWKLVQDRSPGRHTPTAQYNLGFMYDKGTDVKQDHKAAATWYRKAAEQGVTAAQCNLGLAYAFGRGVKQDYKESAKWLRFAAEQGVAAAQHNLGTIYHNGVDVPADFAEALKWFQSAAEQGVENSLKALDLMQQKNLIPTPPPGTAVTAILLTSAAGSRHNNKPGTVVTPAEGAAVKPCQVTVLLEGAATPIAFKLMNLRV